MIWNPEYETMARADLEELQLRRLQTTVAWVYERVPYYRTALDERGVKPRDIRSLADVAQLPFTDKTALRDTYPFGLFAVPLDQVVRIHSSSGTTGKPIVVGYTKGDIATWTELTARVASAAGVRSTDLAQMAFGYGMFTGGFGMHYGLERIGATVIPASAGNTERHLMMMQDFGTTVLISTPSYALYLAEVGQKLGIDFQTMPLRLGLFGAEPCSDAARREIEANLFIRATDNYGLSEVMGPGVSGECECDCGLHINEDHFFVEIVDPVTGEPRGEGEEGELVITPLTKEAFPVLRYRTHDLTVLDRTPCECGRTLVRMNKVRQRTDDMLIIRGVNVFPSQIEDVLFKIEDVRPHYLIVVDRKHGLDDIELRLEVAEEVFSDIMADMVAFTKNVSERLHSVLGLNVKVTLVEPGTIERTAGKARHVLDLRDQGC
ncbi:MAG: phenylacetate--CoA ligase [Anaerosomatales bacterium]|nr:phenylacetate--CoA ligase [Anaerosomatales bacterium]MDT8433334.1 phenylacetate--CoA ligase [Anaerosomatales bacterium]